MIKATKDPLVQEIGKRLVKVRQYKKLTKEQMAELMGISITRYEKMEQGQSRIGLEQMYRVIGDDPWLSIDYISSGKHSKDKDFERGYRKIPADRLKDLMHQYGITSENWDSFEFNTVIDFFSAISQYGEEHHLDVDLREAPAFTVYTDMFEVMVEQASEE